MDDLIRAQIVDFDMKFSSIVWLMVKLAFAVLPAAFIIGMFIYGGYALFERIVEIRK
jgi:hypothetical protein